MTPLEREALIVELLPLARRVARGIARFAPAVEYDDCYGDACIAVIKAVDTYDPARGVPLWRYAQPIVAGAVINGLRKRDTVSESARRVVRRADDQKFAEASQTGRLPSEREMEERVPALRHARLSAHRASLVSLDAPLPEGEAIAIDWCDDPAHAIGDHDVRRRVREHVRALPDRLRRVVALRYYGERSTAAVGETLGVSPQRISQLHAAALDKLRSALPEEYREAS